MVHIAISAARAKSPVCKKSTPGPERSASLVHTHVVVMNRVQTSDGVWRTLDSRGLFRSIVGLSQMYNGVLSDYLTQARGWGWEGCARRHSDVPKFEVAGVSERLREEFSSRSTEIERHSHHPSRSSRPGPTVIPVRVVVETAGPGSGPLLEQDLGR